jgi:hypothetical protein
MSETAAALTGHIDQADRFALTGWAMDPARPGEAVELELVLDGAVIGSFLADRHRADLEAAGLGEGRLAFQVQFPGGLSSHAERVVELRRVGDGAAVPGSPVVFSPEPLVGETARRVLEDAVAASGGDGAVIDALVAAIAERLPNPAPHHAALLARHGVEMPAVGGRRALVIDESLPDPGRDAGSSAVLSHMRALARLGFSVEIVPAHDMVADAAAVARMRAEGFLAWTAPWVGSVEEVLRRGGFDVVYIHRLAPMLRYGGLVRRWCPAARLVYCVADLHHLRAEREAALVTGIAGNAATEELREAELAAIRAADAPITHSGPEQARLAALLPGVAVHVVPWEVALPPPPGPASGRRGVGFCRQFRPCAEP